MKKALITGITGQDGSYLAEFLLEKGYEVHGVTRRASISNTLRIDHLILENAIRLHDGDLSDSSSLIRIINLVQPDEIYNLAAQSHVQVSFDVPEYSGDVDAIAYRIIDCRKYLKVDNFAGETIILLVLLIVVACLINYNIYFAALLNVIIIIMFVKKYRYELPQP